jgi:hypothetical protein
MSKISPRKAVAAALLLAGAAMAGPSSAHHSFAMFDMTRDVVLEGTVSRFQFTNPHVWVYLTVRDASGQTVEHAIEGGSPTNLARVGWSRTTIRTGDRATVHIHPLRSGATGGSLISITIPGRQIGTPQ